jgi:hypothetical protein
MASPSSRLRRFLVLVFVGFIHLFIIGLISRLEHWSPDNRAAQSLILLDLSSRAPKAFATSAPGEVEASRNHKTKETQTSNAKDARDSQPDAVGTSSSSSLPQPRSPPIDWDTEAEQASQSYAASILQQLQKRCKEAALTGEQFPECRRYKRPDAWAPEPKRFDIAGGLPFMRLGKRCVIGLGFFGCGVGKLPDPNSHVLDDMHEPDRPRSSIPAPNE